MNTIPCDQCGQHAKYLTSDKGRSADATRATWRILCPSCLECSEFCRYPIEIDRLLETSTSTIAWICHLQKKAWIDWEELCAGLVRLAEGIGARSLMNMTERMDAYFGYLEAIEHDTPFRRSVEQTAQEHPDIPLETIKRHYAWGAAGQPCFGTTRTGAPCNGACKSVKVQDFIWGQSNYCRYHRQQVAT